MPSAVVPGPPTVRPHSPLTTDPAGAPSAGAPPADMGGLRSNVPAALSSFIGRVREVAAARELLAASRLLTIVGPGGAGKTRLAREVAAAGAAPDELGGVVGTDAHPPISVISVWWAELASIAPGGSADDVLQAVGTAAGVHPTSGAGGMGDAVEAAFADARTLLVLDNCEHVVDAAARVAERLLRACPRLRVLATSREALGTEGETAWQLPPLAHPAPGAPAADAIAAGDLAGFDAVALFIDRARAASPGFALTAATAPAVAAICGRLDGMPLAIELAAAALPALGVDAVAARLGDALSLLTRGRRTALPHHRTLRAVLDWSYQRLDPAAQALLARLSVFRGPFVLDAAELVGGRGAQGGDPRGGDPRGSDLPGGVPVFDALGRLVEQSLVDLRETRAGDAGGGEPRYVLLETVRQYGAERLRGTPDDAVARRNHAEWVRRLAEAAWPLFWSAAHQRTVDRLRPELDDARAALTWATAPGGDALLGVQIAGALGFFWVTGVPWEDGRRWTRLAADAGERAGLGDPGQTVAVRLAFVRSLLFCGGQENHLGNGSAGLVVAARLGEVLATIEPDLDALRAAGDPRWATELADWTDALRWARASERDIAAHSLLQMPTPDPAAVLARARAIPDIADTLHNRWYATLLYGRFASVLGALGRNAEAAAWWDRSIAGFRAHDDPWMLSFALQGAAVNAFALGQLGAAATHAADSVGVLRAQPDPWFVSRALDTLAAVCVAPGDGTEADARARAAAAARLLGAAAMLRRRFGLTVLHMDVAHHTAAHAGVDRVLGAADAEAEQRVGAALALDAVIALATESARLLPNAPAPNDAAPDRGAARAPAAVAAEAVETPAVAGALRVDVLGRLAVCRGGRALADDELPGGKVRELLLYLVCHPEGRTRDEIGLALGPDASAAQLRNQFHVVLHTLRRALGDPRWVTYASNAYALARAGSAGTLDADVDVVLGAANALRAAVRRTARGTGAPAPADLAAAVDVETLAEIRAGLARYRGPLATVTGLGATAGDWIVAHQDRVRTAWADGTALLGVVESAAGHHAEAIATFARVLDVEPLREGVHRALMQAYVAAGELRRALAHYDALAALLAREVGAAPARETQALAERLRRGG